MSTAKDKLATRMDIGTQKGSGWIWIAYSAFFLIEPVMRHNSRYWLKCGAIYLIFLALYIGKMRARTPRKSHLLVAGFYLLGVFTLPLNEGASTFFIYFAAFLPFVVVSSSIVLVLIALSSLTMMAEGLSLHLDAISLALWSCFVVVVGTSNLFIARQKRSDCKLRLAHQEIEQLAALAERERIARDLHDVLGHTLSVIVLKSELAGRLIERDPQRAALEIADVERTARTALSEVRVAIGGYRAQGLAAEMELARNTLNAADVALSCESPLPKLSIAEETALCLTVREAVTNIVRHARAKHCRMRFAMTADNYFSLLVEDDGTHAVVREGNGLRGMRERIQAMGGRFSISTSAGTTLRVELPGATQAAIAPVNAVAQ